MRRGQNGIAAEGQLMRVYLLTLPSHSGRQGTALAHWREVPALTLSLLGTALSTISRLELLEDAGGSLGPLLGHLEST